MIQAPKLTGVLMSNLLWLSSKVQGASDPLVGGDRVRSSVRPVKCGVSRSRWPVWWSADRVQIFS